MTRTIAALCCLLMTLIAGGARGDSLPPPGVKHLHVEPLAEQHGAGAAFDIALVFRPDPGWHGYWGENTGDAGFPPKFSWTAPAGTRIGSWRWPVPTTLKIAGLMNYVYDAPFAPIVRVQLPPARGGVEQVLKLHVAYLVCTDALCVPEDQDVSFQLTATDTDAGVPPALDRWRAALPRPLGATATYASDGGALRLAIPYPASAPLSDAYFFPRTAGAIDYAAPQSVTRDGDRLTIATTGKAKGAIDGVLRIGPGQGLAVHAVPGVVSGHQGWLMTALLAFGGAVLGGLILNVMPCVFPILSLKALSLARSGMGAAEARREAVAYSAGVVLVCLALGAAILGLRAGGVAVGWAFQLQSPVVVELLLLLTAAMAFNLAGLFELPTPALGEMAGRGGAFLTGALAAVIATPCTGPFMGAALGAALVLPWPVALAIFAGLGLGLALPFLAIGFVPALRRRLPRPGAWMERARRFLSLPMFLTALALAWLLGRQAGVDAMSYGLLAVLGLAMVLWAAGRRQAQGRGLGRPAVVLMVATAIAGAWLVQRTRATPGVAAAVAGEERFSEARLAQLRAQNRPVFAYFTADWCLTCKVNERVAIDPAREALRRKGVAVLVGDWTDGDPALGRFIQAHNRAGVPLYLYYPAGREARVLPQVLTPGMLAGL